MRVLCLIAAVLLMTGAANLPPSHFSQAWFSSLSQDQRLELQGNLILTGDYAALVDGLFGPATYAALQRFERRHGEFPSGVLSQSELDTLNSEADAIARKLGIAAINDEASGLSAFLPTKVLTKQAPSDGGTSYSTADGGLRFLTLGFDAGDATLADLRDVFLKPEAGRTITYSALDAYRVVVSGKYPDHRFYALFSRSRGRFIGYTVNWVPDYDELGALVAVFAASYSLPTSEFETSSGPDDVRQTVPPSSPYPAQGERVGAFLLPADDPAIIVLDGEINGNIELDFLRVLKMRPQAKTLVLNSTGGLVAPALVIAHEVDDRALNTLVPAGSGCYSACAFIYFAGRSRTDLGWLGVHQIYGDKATAESAQLSLSDILDALKDFDVSQGVISVMLRTPPEAIHVFTEGEITSLSINRATSSDTSSPQRPTLSNRIGSLTGDSSDNILRHTN